MHFFYIAQPITNQETDACYRVATHLCLIALNRGYIPFSPFLHTQQFAETYPKVSHGTYMRWDMAFLSAINVSPANCLTMIFCKGWEESAGCTIEHGWAKANNIKILYDINELEVIE